MGYKVLQKTNKKLRLSSEPINEINWTIRKLAHDMIQVMKRKNGIGIAAPQIGENIRLVIVPINNKPTVMVNPKIIDFSKETDIDIESCLSVKGKYGKVERYKEIKVFFKNLSGCESLMQLKGLEARCTQHEIDHLDGILYIDKLIE